MKMQKKKLNRYQGQTGRQMWLVFVLIDKQHFESKSECGWACIPVDKYRLTAIEQ